jgi:putative transposase
MARIARVVAPGVPHHVTQRGNRRQETFFSDEDYDAYVDLMAEWCAARGVEVWAYCLMPNHVHLIAVPQSEDALARAVGEAHRRYTRMVNFRERWRGHLWQGRFASFPMDEAHTYRCARYVELNPVRAGLVETPRAWRHSSARAHLAGKDDRLAKVKPLLDMAGDWGEFLAGGAQAGLARAIRRHERTGRPLGGDTFVEGLEKALGRVLRRQRPGPKPSRRRRRR